MRREAAAAAKSPGRRRNPGASPGKARVDNNNVCSLTDRYKFWRMHTKIARHSEFRDNA